MKLNVKADQVGPQHAMEDLSLPGTDAEDSGFGQGMCQKEATRASGLFSLLFAGKGQNGNPGPESRGPGFFPIPQKWPGRTSN